MERKLKMPTKRSYVGNDLGSKVARTYLSPMPKAELGSKEHIAGSAAAIGATAYFVNKKPKPKGLKAPTAKTSEKVMIRGIKNMPELVSENKAKAFTRTYEHHTKRHGMSKKLARIGSKAANQSDALTAFKRGMGKALRVSNPIGMAAAVMSPTKLGDASLYKGFKQKEFKRK